MKEKEHFDNNIILESLLAKILMCEEHSIRTLFDSKYTFNFLILWSCFETKIFDKYCTSDKILKNEFSIRLDLKNELNEEIEYFKKRYQNENKLENLFGIGKNSNQSQKSKLEKNKLYIGVKSYLTGLGSDFNDLQFILTIVFRFRNNIFHGNKGIFTKSKLKNVIGL